GGGDDNAAPGKRHKGETPPTTDPRRKAVATNALGCGQPSCAIRGAWRQPQASNASPAHARRKAFDADNTFSRDHAGPTIASRQAASAHSKTGDPAPAIGAVKGDHGGAGDSPTPPAPPQSRPAAWCGQTHPDR